jgi:hypothetical protein
MWTDLVQCSLVALYLTLVCFPVYYFVRRILKKDKKLKLIKMDTPILSPNSFQEDTRDAATKKRVRKAIEEQEQQLTARALKAHSADCPDPLTCTKDPCFIYGPDKIIGKPRKFKKVKEKSLSQSED